MRNIPVVGYWLKWFKIDPTGEDISTNYYQSNRHAEKRVPSLAHLGSEDVGEEAEVDLPVACTFTDQAKQRELHQKQINKAIIESRLKTKAIRKAKHNRQKQATHQLEEPANQEIRFLPINEAKKSKKKDSLEEEFDCPGYFRVSDHVHYSEPEDDSSVQNELSNLDVSTSDSPNGSESICGNESDEGYDGSEEQDRSKLKTILFDDTNFSTVKLTKGHSKKSDSAVLDHRTWTKINRLNGIHVRILDSTNIEKKARQACDSFRRDHLFSSSYSGRYGNVKRIAPNLLKNLSRKKKALTGVR